MRIISGTARGCRLKALPGDDTRPTLERVKEGVFSAVQFWLPGARVLDLYAGSGQMGLEALSRGAKSCVFVDAAPAAVAVIEDNVKHAGFEGAAKVLRSSAEAFLAYNTEHFDLILADPPYGQNTLPPLLQQLLPHCGPGALVLCESEPGAGLPERVGALRLTKQYRYGTVLVSRYKLEDGG